MADELDKKAEETDERKLKLKNEQDIVQANLEAQREQHEKEEEELISIKQVPAPAPSTLEFFLETIAVLEFPPAPSKSHFLSNTSK